MQPCAGNPACSIASRFWQAVTPEPQYITASPGGRPDRSARNSRAASLAAASCRRRPDSAEEVIGRTRDVPGDAIDRFGPSFESLRRARVDQQRLAIRGARDDFADFHAIPLASVLV